MRKTTVVLFLSITGLVLVIVSLVLGYGVFGAIVKSEVEKEVRLEDGTIQYERWEVTPFPMSFKIYFFNVSNPDEATFDNVKPKVEQRGPYVYKLQNYKVDIERDSDADTLTYDQFNSYVFDQEASGENTEDDMVTIVNVPFGALLQVAEKDFIDLYLMWINLHWNTIFPDTTSLFHTVRVGDYLFDGYRFCDPDVASSLGKLICGMVADLSQDTMEILDDGSIKFSFFKRNQNATEGRYTVGAGMKKMKDLGYITSWNNKTKINTWTGENSECNVVKGRDSTIYPPFSKEEDSYDIFSTDICRVVTLQYVRDEEHEGVTGQRREFHPNVYGHYDSAETECYCLNMTKGLNGEERCAPAGFLDLYNCLDAPVLLSHPHFLHADEEYASTVEGLNPVHEDHSTFVTIEPGTGTPLRGAKKAQLNMIIRPITRIDVTKNVKPSVIPIFYMDEGMELPAHLVDELKDKYLNVLVILTVVQWVLFGIGLILFIGCAYYYFKLKSDEKMKLQR